MVKKVASGVLMVMLLVGLYIFDCSIAKAQTAAPTQAVITVSGVPASTNGLAVEVTVDTSVVTLGSGSSSVSGALVVTGGMSEGVGIISTSGALPASFTITVPFTGVKAGTSMVTVGMVLDMIGGTPIAGASATVDASSVTVTGSAPPPTPTPTPSSGGGSLSSNTVTVTVTGDAVKQTNALNVTLAFSDAAVAGLDTGVTFTGAGAQQLLTDVKADTGVLTVVWNGTVTDGMAVITGMLKAGSKAGTANITVTKVEAAGGTDVTSSVVAVVSPTSVTNSASTTTSSTGTFSLIAPTAVTGPGKAAVAFSASGTPKGLTATLNGSKVEFFDGDKVGVAIVSVPASGTLNLKLATKVSGKTTNVDLGSVTVTAGTGKAPKVKSASAVNSKSRTKLTVVGSRLSKADTTVIIVPKDRKASATSVKGRTLKATYPASECIPKGSFANVSTPGGIDAKKIKVRGRCSNKLD